MSDRADEALGGSPGVLAKLLFTEETLSSVLDRVVSAAREAVPGCDHAGVTLVSDGRATTAAATDERTLALDAAQYRTGGGPCLEAIRSGDRIQVHDLDGDGRFRTFAEAALPQGLRSSLSLPLRVRGEAIGALDLYAERVDAYREQDEGVAETFAENVAVALANAQVHHRTTQLVGQLNEALESRAVIEQAKGILMVRQRIDADAAFEILRRASQNRNQKLRDIAAQIVATATSPPGGGDQPAPRTARR